MTDNIWNFSRLIAMLTTAYPDTIIVDNTTIFLKHTPPFLARHDEFIF